MNSILTAIYSKFSGSALATDVSSRIYLDQAPDNCTFPYVVYFIVSDTPEDHFAKDGEMILIQFSLFSSSEGAAEITDMYTDLKTLFDDCSMTITSHSLVWFRRMNLTTMVEELVTAAGTQQVKAWHVDYEIQTQES